MHRIPLQQKIITVFSFFFFLSSFAGTTLHAQGSMGEGIGKPRIAAGTTLYLYSGELIDDLLHHAAKKDSVTLVQGQYSVEIGSAPDWFAPELVKLDYDLFHLRVVTVSRNWLEVVVNTRTGKTAWVDRSLVVFSSWPDFLLEVFGVEKLSGIKNPVRIKPADNATILADPGEQTLRVIAVKGEWLKVALPQDNPAAVPRLGWIRWKRGFQWLITWSVLS